MIEMKFDSYTETRGIEQREQVVPPQHFTRQSIWLTVLKGSLISIVVILLLKGLLLWLMIHLVYNGSLDHFLTQMEQYPVKLAFVFMAAYILGAVFMFPVSILMTTMAFTYTHVYGVQKGAILCVTLNFCCCFVAYSFVFFCARYFIGDFVYSKCI